MKKESVIANKHPAASVPRTDSRSPVPRRVMHQRMAIGVASVALLGACTTPIASADYPADKKKYDDCVANEKDQYPVPLEWLIGLRKKSVDNCGEPPTRPKDEKK